MAIGGVIMEGCEAVSDGRRVTKCRHHLKDILVIGLCGTIAQAETWEAMVTFAQGTEAWLGEWVEVAHGIRWAIPWSEC
jgi:hypothetical protein